MMNTLKKFVVLEWNNESVMRGFAIGIVRATSLVAARALARRKFGKRVSVRPA
jgi:hypothetical protein